MSAPRPPPRRSPLVWARANLFATPVDAAITVILAAAAGWLVWRFLDWAVVSANFEGESRSACRAGGACWALVTARWRQLLLGFYPKDHLWRVAAAAGFLAVSVVPIVSRRLPVWALLLAPIGVGLAFAVLGGAHILPSVPTDYWGGFFLNILIGLTCAVFALPVGVLLAFGRRSSLPAVSLISTGFIELVRAVPLITVLFMASVVVPLFLPSGMDLNKLLRALVVITLFESAYMAEVVRGGLQAVPEGQREAARALGLDPFRATLLVVLPQALKISIPAIVSSFIGLFKDTTLVYVISILEVTGMVRLALADYAWQGRDVEGYAFIAVCFWIACFAMSRFSASLERRSKIKDPEPA